MVDDPEPWFRCRCATGSVSRPDAIDPYYFRCTSRPTAEDGLCDHCRQEVCTACGEGQCCRSGWPTATVALTEPCAAVNVGAPF